MSEKKEPKRILLSELKKQVDEGMKLKPLAEYYEIPVAQMKRVLKQAGLKIRSFRGPQFTLIDDVAAKEELPQFPWNEEPEDSENNEVQESAPEASEETQVPNNDLTPNYNY